MEATSVAPIAKPDCQGWRKAIMVMRTNVKRPRPQPAAVASAIEAEGFVARINASLLTVFFPIDVWSDAGPKRRQIHEGIDSTFTFADSIWGFK
ncbi:hypothetical protein CUJ84_pRLN2000026 (plasmid) [Rhizobium leguminosarum]|uniref:Uncharacterized protein n=2 Tax=Rhizobium TaxID=379 RepID=A0A2K9ZE95_RHILE|nr:hypothetical protein CUJ84_pRLN2000026 [Rhizobium leguminosarum]